MQRLLADVSKETIAKEVNPKTPLIIPKPVAVEEERWYSPVVIQLAREAAFRKKSWILYKVRVMKGIE